MRKRKSSSTATSSRKQTAAKPGNASSAPSEHDVTRSAEFRKASAAAESYAKDPDRLRKLLTEAREKINHIPRGPFGETWPYLMGMIRLIRAFHQGEYRDIARVDFLTVIAAIVYFVSPLDLIPDSMPILGHIDDAYVVRLALESVRADLDKFMAWETSKV